MGSADALLDGQVNAAPPGPSATARSAPSPAKTAAKIRDAMAVSRQQSMGSNALAVGSQGKNRMWQSQLTIPGKINVSGASLLGFPAVNIGHNENVAWSHTVATVAPFGLFDVQVDPLNPTKYSVDGAWEEMTSQRVSVDVRKPDGSLTKVDRTLWSTRYGPITTSMQGVPLPWVVSAHAVRDVNMDNLRAMNTWFGLDQAADVHARSCLTETGKLLFHQSLPLPNVPPISILDGKRSACDGPTTRTRSRRASSTRTSNRA